MVKDVMLGIHLGLEEFIERLQSECDLSMEQMIYVEVHSPTFPIPLRLGSYELHGDIDVADLTMTHLGKILQSYQSPRVNEAQLEFMITVLNTCQAAKLRQKKGRGKLPVNVYENDIKLAGL